MSRLDPPGTTTGRRPVPRAATPRVTPSRASTPRDGGRRASIGREPVRREPARREPARREPARREPVGRQAPRREPAGRQALRGEPIPRQSAPRQSTPRQLAGRPPARRPPVQRQQRRRVKRKIARLGMPHRRLHAGLLVIGFVMIIFTGRLLQLQGVDSTVYAADAHAQYLHKVTLPAQRGAILDRNGAVLADTVNAFDITGDPKVATESKTTTPWAMAGKLAPLLGLSQFTLVSDLTGKKQFVYLAHQVTPQVEKQVLALKLPGISAESTNKRVYPAGDVAANVLGFVGSDGKGLGGLEYQYQIHALRQGRPPDGRARSQRPGDSGRRRKWRCGDPRTRHRAHPRPRHSVEGAAGDRGAGEGHGCRRRIRHRDATAHRSDPRDGDDSDVRSGEAGRCSRAGPRKRCPVRCFRARQHQQGHHDVGRDRQRRAHTDVADRRPADACSREQGVP